MAILNISVGEDLRLFLQDQARKHGFRTEGEYVEAVLREAQRREAATKASPSDGRGSAQSPWDIAAAVSASVPDDEWAKIPQDLSRNVDHYLYGHPKEE